MLFRKNLHTIAITISIFVYALVLAPEHGWSMNFEKGLLAAKEGKFKTALEELEPLADQGNIEAQFTVGLIYMQLKGYAQAEELLKKADSAGHPEASYYIGILYRNGLNGKHDPQEALDWFFRSASFGNRDALYNLHMAFDNGLGGVDEDVQAAFMYALAAAELGHADAQYKLGLLYASGEGVKNDLVLGYMWLEIAAFAESFDFPPKNSRTELRLASRSSVREILDVMSEILTSKQLANAKLKSRDCVKQDFVNCN